MAAAFVGAGTARAAEPGSHRSPPVAAWRACAGGMILPGTNTCLRLGGAVRSSMGVTGGSAASLPGARRSLTRLDTAARLDIDVRTPTDLGPVRVFTSVRMRSPGSAFH